MPKKKYSLVPGEPQRLEISWKGSWKNVSVKLDNNEICVIANLKELKKGRTLSLEDGSSLEIKFVSGFMSAGLQILRNGKPIPGSGTDPEQTLKTSCGIIYFIAGINILLGILGEFFPTDFLIMMGADKIMIGVGIFFGILGHFAKKRSLIALTLAVLFLVVDLLFQIGTTARPQGLIIKIIFIAYIARGYNAIKEINSRNDVYDKVDVFN